MSEIVKPFDGDREGHIAHKISVLAGALDVSAIDNTYRAGDVVGLAVVVIRKGMPAEMWARVDDADRSRLRGSVIDLAGALAAED